MKDYESTEIAYKNGYAQGLKDAVKHGKWIVKKVDAAVSNFQCSECGREERCGNDYFMKPTKCVSKIYPYCHCGAKMDLEEEK